MLSTSSNRSDDVVDVDQNSQPNLPIQQSKSQSLSHRPPPLAEAEMATSLLVIFCVINMLNYVDRGAIASNGVNGSQRTCDDKGICTSGSGIHNRVINPVFLVWSDTLIVWPYGSVLVTFSCLHVQLGNHKHQARGDFKLNNFQDGVLSSAFMVGLLVASPIFASLAKSHNPFRLIGVGLSVWTFATAGCGSSFDFWSIAICRMLVGVGEASFISLAAPFIDDNAPVPQKTAWLSMFYMCIPTGVALGYVYGGVVGSHLNWRYAFWGEAILMLPFAVLAFVIKPLQLKGFAPAESGKAQVVASVSEGSEASNLNDHVSEDISDQASERSIKSIGESRFLNQLSQFSKDTKDLLQEKVYVVNVLGYIAYNFVIGAYSYWGPKAGYNIYHMSNADMMFGGVTIVCGIVGTISGGFILDQMGATISNAFKLLSAATFLGAIFCLTAFCLSSLYGFLALFTVGELLVFATQAPVNYVCLHSVKPSLRALSMAISTVSIHVFGDVPSSPLVGVLQDHVNNWRKTTLALTSIFFLAAGIWFVGEAVRGGDLEGCDSEIVQLEPVNVKWLDELGKEDGLFLPESRCRCPLNPC
ncbi:putative sphingolipid transporter spinster [Citrus sinensis]|uniref:Sphingolipid transporter spinster n=1 Tax=Citrus sinensis TaxID=2711 RepID=A0ACB8J4G2_CITSI|nr:putative sphingolipid transporter spinster [Citrus sinensis]